MRTVQAYEEEEVASPDAEFSLGMGSLIGIFFGLALVCGVFFGFGYMMGHRTPGPYVSSQPLYESPKPAATAIAPKPSAQVPEQPTEVSRVVVPAAAPDNATTPSGPPTSNATTAISPEVASAPAPSVPKLQPVAKATSGQQPASPA